MITKISDRKGTNFLSSNNTLSVEIQIYWQKIVFSCYQNGIHI